MNSGYEFMVSLKGYINEKRICRWELTINTVEISAVYIILYMLFNSKQHPSEINADF